MSDPLPRSLLSVSWLRRSAYVTAGLVALWIAVLWAVSVP